jgi:hypothetical protein
VKLQLTATVDLSVVVLAEAFAQLDDEAQAQFFIEVARLAESWRTPLGPGYQWYSVGKHLRDCSCATEEARDLVREIASGLEGAR